MLGHPPMHTSCGCYGFISSMLNFSALCYRLQQIENLTAKNYWWTNFDQNYLWSSKEKNGHSYSQ